MSVVNLGGLRKVGVVLCGLVLSVGVAGFAFGKDISLGKSQRLYLPIYSHVTYGNADKSGKAAFSLLSAMVSIRNTDGQKPIRVLSAKYYDTEGRFLRNYIAKPIVVQAFGTHELFVDANDKSGGSGANFVIEWESDVPVNLPLVEALHVSLVSGRSITVKTEAVEIRYDDR